MNFVNGRYKRIQIWKMTTMIYENLIIINIIYNSIIFLFIKISLYVLIHLMTTDSILMMLRHQLLLLLIDPLSLQLIHKMIQMSIIANFLRFRHPKVLFITFQEIFLLIFLIPISRGIALLIILNYIELIKRFQSILAFLKFCCKLKKPVTRG